LKNSRQAFVLESRLVPRGAATPGAAIRLFLNNLSFSTA